LQKGYKNGGILWWAWWYTNVTPIFMRLSQENVCLRPALALLQGPGQSGAQNKSLYQKIYLNLAVATNQLSQTNQYIVFSCCGNLSFSFLKTLELKIPT
jgi:hypothetical protein